MSLPSPKDIYLRRWWWSKQPFWKYLDSRQVGWANLVDRHPGLFNLAWCMAGVNAPPKEYEPYSAKVTWVFTEAMYIPMAGKTMADWALKLELPAFKDLLVDDKRQLKRWKFHDSHISYEGILSAVAASQALRA